MPNESVTRCSVCGGEGAASGSGRLIYIAFPPGTGRSSRDPQICLACALARGMHRCAMCGCAIQAGEQYATGYSESQVVCPACFSGHFAECVRCHHNFFVQGDMVTLRDGNILCTRCHAQEFWCCRECGFDNRREPGVEPNHANCQNCNRPGFIHSHGWKPPKFKFTKEPWENTLFLGVELEVEGDTDKSHDFAGKVGDCGCGDRVYLVHDGSLHHGFEIVSHPATLNGHKTFGWYKMLKWLRAEGFESHDPGTCGLHVHMSRRSFSNQEIVRMTFFVNKVHDYLRRFFRRTEQQTASFCARWTMEELDWLWRNGPRNIPVERYKNINLCPMNTIEFRLPRGTLNPRMFIATLETADAIATFCRQSSSVFMKTKDEPEVWREFCRFVKDRYYNLFKMLVDFNLTSREELQRSYFMKERAKRPRRQREEPIEMDDTEAQLSAEAYVQFVDNGLVWHRLMGAADNTTNNNA